MSAMSAAWRMTVLLPAMLGPVMTSSWPASGRRRWRTTATSLGTKPPESGGSMRLHHRVAAVRRSRATSERVEHRAPVAALGGDARRARGARRRWPPPRRRARRRAGLGHHPGPQLLEELLLERDAPLLGAEHLLLELLQLRGDEALAAHRGLAPL